MRVRVRVRVCACVCAHSPSIWAACTTHGCRGLQRAAEGRRGQQRAARTVQLSSEGCEAAMYKPAGPRCSATVPPSRGGKWRAIIKGCGAPNVMSSLVFGLCLVRLIAPLASLPPCHRSTIHHIAAGAAPASKSLPRAIFLLKPPDLHCESLHDPIASPCFPSSAVRPHILVACPPAAFAFACPRPYRSTQQ
jgi:hypothetical protein